MTEQLAFTFDAPPPAPPPPPLDDRALLGLTAEGPLDSESVRHAHRVVASRHHPDAGGNPQKYQALAEARDRLLAGLRGAAP